MHAKLFIIHESFLISRSQSSPRLLSDEGALQGQKESFSAALLLIPAAAG